MIILGFDPGVAITGFAIIKKPQGDEKPKVLDFGCITTESSLPAGKRLEIIHKEVKKLITTHQPNLISVENLYFFKNLKTVKPVSQAKGVILLAAAQHNVRTEEFTPLQVKMTVAGYGRAEKKQVQKMVHELLDMGNLKAKQKHRKKDDASDALGIALCGLLKETMLGVWNPNRIN